MFFLGELGIARCAAKVRRARVARRLDRVRPRAVACEPLGHRDHRALLRGGAPERELGRAAGRRRGSSRACSRPRPPPRGRRSSRAVQAQRAVGRVLEGPPGSRAAGCEEPIASSPSTSQTAIPRGDGCRGEHDPRVSLDVEEGGRTRRWRSRRVVPGVEAGCLDRQLARGAVGLRQVVGPVVCTEVRRAPSAVPPCPSRRSRSHSAARVDAPQPVRERAARGCRRGCRSMPVIMPCSFRLR